MYYDYAITVTANTLESAPKKQILKLAKGIIHRVEVEMYPGCHRYVGCRLYYHNHQIYPRNLDGEFKTDGYTIAFDDYQEILREPYEVEFRGYSPTSTYDHTVVIRVGVLESSIAIMGLKMVKGLSVLFKVFGIKV